MTATGRTRVPPAVWIVAAILAVALIGLLMARVVSNPNRAYLASSGPQETVLRSVRLAGIERAAVGATDGTAVLRLDVPMLASAPDVEISWQAGFGTLVAAYPDVSGYTVQIFADGGPLVQLEGSGDEVRIAVEDDDAGALNAVLASRIIVAVGKEASSDVMGDLRLTVVPAGQAERAAALVAAWPEGATFLPDDTLAIDVHVAGAYLDAKNRAAGLLGDEGPLVEDAGALSDAATLARSSAPGVRAPGAGERVVELYIARLRAALASASLPGGAALLTQIEALGPDPGREAVARLRSQVLAVEAVVARSSPDGILGDARAVAAQVESAPLAPGALSDAVLAAADADSAPKTATEVRSFERSASLDVRPSASVADSSLPERVLRLNARGGTPPSLGWSTPDGGSSVAPDTWLAYRRADGAVYWLAGEDGEVSLTDASLRGWAFSRGSAALVDASRCGRVLVFFATE